MGYEESVGDEEDKELVGDKVYVDGINDDEISVDSNADPNNDSEDDLLNQCSPAIELYKSRLEQDYGNNSGEYKEVASESNSDSKGRFIEELENGSTVEGSVEESEEEEKRGGWKKKMKRLTIQKKLSTITWTMRRGI